MTRKQRIEFWHKKQAKCAGPASQAVHTSLKDGKPVLNPVGKLTGAQGFMSALKVEIRKAVR